MDLVARANIKNSKTVIQNITKYIITSEQLNRLESDAIKYRAIFRRFVRLRPLIVDRQVKKYTYSKYLRHRWVSDGAQCQKPPELKQNLMEETLNTLQLLQVFLSDDKELGFGGQILVSNVLQNYFAKERTRRGESVTAFDELLKSFNEMNGVRL